MRVLILCAFLGAFIAAPATCKQNKQSWLQLAKKVVPNFNTFCSKAGGQCVDKSKCDVTTSVPRNFCKGTQVCCLPKAAACEKLMRGFCTKDKTTCAQKKGYMMTQMKCGGEAHCCRPQLLNKPAKKLRGIKRCMSCFKKSGAGSCKHCPLFLRRSYQRHLKNGTEAAFRIRPWHKKMWTKWTLEKTEETPEEAPEGADANKVNLNQAKANRVKRINRRKQKLLRAEAEEAESNETAADPDFEILEELEDEEVMHVE